MFQVYLALALANSQPQPDFTNGRRCGSSTFVTGDPLPPPDGDGKHSYFIESIDVLREPSGKIVGYVYSDHDRVVQLLQVGRDMDPEYRAKLGLGAVYAERESFALMNYRAADEPALHREHCVSALVKVAI